MNNEEIKKYREEQDRKETAKMMKAINENYKKANREYHKQQEKALLQEQIDKINKEKAQKKEVIVNFALVVVVILTLCVMLIAMLSFSTKSQKGSLDQCVNAGFDQTYCERQMGL